MTLAEATELGAEIRRHSKVRIRGDYTPAHTDSDGEHAASCEYYARGRNGRMHPLTDVIGEIGRANAVQTACAELGRLRLLKHWPEENAR